MAAKPPRAGPPGARWVPGTPAKPAAPRAPAPRSSPEPQTVPAEPRVPAGWDPTRRERDAELARHLGEGRIGAADVGPDELASFAEFAIGRHLYARMARPGPDREAEIERLAEGLLGLADPRRAKRVIDALLAAERFVDVYPLELLDRVLERAPDHFPACARGALVTNRRFLESRLFEVEEPIPFELPLGARIWGFAISGGAQPGYCFEPGAPGRYQLELAAEGRFEILLLGRTKGVDLVDRVRLWVEGPPDLAH